MRALKAEDKSLSADARAIVRYLGTGFKLRVPHDGSMAELVSPEGSSKTVEDPVVKELISSGQVHKLTELGEPPIRSEERKRARGWRCGWREIGLDGSTADWYLLTQ